MVRYFRIDNTSLKTYSETYSDGGNNNVEISNPLKILVVTNLYPYENNQTWGIFVKEQVDALIKYFPNIAIDIITIDGYKSKWEYLKGLHLLPGLIKKNAYDIVHAHYGLTLLSLVFVSIPVVVTYHGSDLLTSPVKYLCKLLSWKASKSIVVSKGLKDELGHGEVIPCGIDVKRFLLPSNHLENQYRTKSGCLKVLFPSNPTRKDKDYSLFEAVCQELENRCIKVEKAHLLNVKREDVPELFWNCDLMLLTSLSEGSPTVIKEAIAAKLPFVSVDVGDVKEWASYIDFGKVAPNRDAGTIADMAISLLNQVESRSALDNSTCIKKMDLAEIAKRIKCLYDEIMNLT